MINQLIKKLSAFCLLWIVAFNHPYSQSNINSQILTDDYSLDIGEELTYIVKYAFFNLGEVKFKITKKTMIEGTPVTETIAYMDSYEDLPFISLHQIYYSYINDRFLPVKFLGLMLEEDTNFVKYIFRSDSVIAIQKGNYNTGRIRFDSTALVNNHFQDGLSILYYTRSLLNNKGTINIPCFVNEKEETTTINIYKENVPVEIDAVDYEIDCKRIDGKTDFVSVYGLTGHFEGWFTNDEKAVPVLAKMNVIIGSITLELIKWKKEGWNPPKYTD